MDRLARKRLKEQQVIEEMIALYCRGKHHTAEGLCDACQTLADYAKARSEACPFMATKTFCANCEVHCYQPSMRAQVREVMRYAAPRMLIRRPLMTLWHVVATLRERWLR